jgi:pyruvate dehydrogenase E1 component beta subunit
MDYDTILTSVKTNRLVVLEEAGLSLGDYLYRSRTCFFLDAPIQRITTADTQRLILSLIEEWLPNADDVIKAVKKSYV